MSVWVTEQGVSEYCLDVSQDPTDCYYQIPEQESLIEIVGIPTILFFIACAVALVFLYKWSMKQREKIACPHCGAKWWSSNVRGGMGLGNSYWTEYFCYNCQRYWT